MAKTNRYTVNQQGVVTMSFDGYIEIVNVCERVKKQSEDPDFTDVRMKFTSMDVWPTVADLKILDVESDFAAKLPYLVFYYEVYETDDPGFQATKDYLQDLFKRKLIICD